MSDSIKSLKDMVETPEFKEKMRVQAEQEIKKEEQKKEDEKRKLLELANIPVIFKDARLNNWKADTHERMQILNKARKFIHFVLYRRKIGLLLKGTTGTGKSRLAATIANELIDKAIAVQFIISAEIQEADYSRLLKIPFLIIDDLGLADGDWRVKNLVTRLIARRHYNGLSTIVTTNNEGEELSKQLHDTVIHRLGATCAKINFVGMANERLKEGDDIDDEFDNYEVSQ